MRGLFVSLEHRRLASLRMHRANHCIVYALAGLLAAQAVFVWDKYRASASLSALAVRRAAAESGRLRLEQEDRALVALASRVKEAQSWSEASARKKTVTQFLSALESCVNDSVCLSEVTFQNRAVRYKDRDRVQLEVVGFARGGGLEEFRESMEKCFGEWDMSVMTGSKAAVAENAGGLVHFSFTVRDVVSFPRKREVSR